MTLPDRAFGAASRGLVAFAAAGLATAFFAASAEFLDVLSDIAFAGRCLRWAVL
jgi:hypothetical protein